MRPDSRKPDELRPSRNRHRLPEDRGGFGSHHDRQYASTVCRERGDIRACIPAQYRQGLGDSRVLDVAPGDFNKDTAREVAKGRPSGRTHEIQRLDRAIACEAVIDLSVLGERSIVLDCDVLQADGGTRVASITVDYVALALAVKQMQKYKMVSKSPLTGAVAAISVGMLNGEAILDLCYEEDSRADVDANVVMTGGGPFSSNSRRLPSTGRLRRQSDGIYDRTG